jgi:hypothetical protein
VRFAVLVHLAAEGSGTFASMDESKKSGTRVIWLSLLGVAVDLMARHDEQDLCQPFFIPMFVRLKCTSMEKAGSDTYA